MMEWLWQVQHQLNLWQRELNLQVSSGFHALDEQGWMGVLLIWGVSFLYGMVHAAGPGHGKLVVASYFIAQGRKISQALKMGYLIALIHAFSALALTFGIYYLIEGAFTKTFNQTLDSLYTVSGVLILGVGGYLLYELWRDWNAKEQHASIEGKKPLMIALSIGIVPCPGVMTVLLFSLMMGHLAVGIAAAGMMSLGMGLTIALAAVAAQQGIGARSDRVRYLSRSLQVASPVFVLGIGMFLIM